MVAKTPEQLADEHVQAWWGDRDDNLTLATRQAFLAGYQARDKEVAELKVNWTFCCKDKARLLKELGQAEAAAPQWISVKDRLPEVYKLVLCCAVGKLDTTYGYIEKDKTWTCNDEPEDSLTKIDHISFITHWMPLPEPPKE